MYAVNPIVKYIANVTYGALGIKAAKTNPPVNMIANNTKAKVEVILIEPPIF